MKKLLVSFILVAAFAITSEAQFRFGVKGGINFSKFSTSIEELESSATAWQVGLVSQFKIPIVGLGIQPELLYTISKGEDSSISYFQLPINLRWQPLPIPLVKPVILAGPYFGYAVNFSGFKDGIKDNIKKFDWGIGLGLGVEIWKFQVAGRYSWGLQDISKVSEFDIKNNVFSLSAAYFF